MKNLLALDTSSQVLSMAIKCAGAPIREIQVDGFLQHAENLLPVLKSLLKQEKLKLDAIDAFLIGRGPGSFTGLRIGFATLKGLIAVRKKPCFGALSFDMIAENVMGPDQSHLAVCLDARRDKVFTRLYQRQKQKWRPRQKPQLLQIEAFKQQLPHAVQVTGDAMARYAEILKQDMNNTVEILPESCWRPRAAALIHFFENDDPKLAPLTKPRDFMPLYFRLTEAEEKRKSHGVRS
jgi:tRNA threonylcarbamoyladenosine biosynthesis protein TsaB